MSNMDHDRSAEILQHLSDAAILTDTDYRVIYWNPGAEALYGIRADEAKGRPIADLIDVLDKPQDRENVRHHVVSEGRWRGHARHKPKGGEPIWVDWSVSTFDLEGQAKGYLAITRDITEHKKQDDRTEHLNASLQAIRKVNQLITKENDPEELIRKACECLTETLGYFNAWIACFDEKKRLTTVKESGVGDHFAPLLDEMQQGKLTRCAKRVMDGGMVVVDDPHVECEDCPLSKMYSGRSAYSAGLRRNGSFYGMLSVSIPAAYAEDEEEKALFQEVADDLSFALYRLEMEAERNLKQKQLKEATQVIEGSPLVLFHWRNEEGWPVEFVSANIERIFGYAPERFLSGELPYSDIIHPDDLDRVTNEVARYVGDKTVSEFTHESYRIINAKGEILYLHDRTYIDRDEDGHAKHFRGVILDVTEEKRLESHYKALVENSVDCIKLLDLEGHLEFMSLGGQKLLEIDDVQSFYGQSWIEFWKEEDQARIRQVVAMAAQGEIGSFEAYCPTVTGKQKWWHVIVSPIVDSDSRVIKLLSVSRDITAQKQTESELHSQYEMMRSITTASPIGISVVGTDGRISFSNESAEKLLHLTQDEISKRSYNDPKWKICTIDGGHFPEEDLPFNRVMQAGEAVFDVQHGIETPDGQRMILSINAAPMKDQAGDITGMVAFMTDITEQLAKDKQIQESEARYRSLFEQASEPIVVVSQDGTILDHNQQKSPLGFEREEMIGRKFFELGVEGIDQLQDRFRNVIDGDTEPFDVELGTKTGEKIWLEIYPSAVREGNQITLRFSIRDITQSKRVDERIQKAMDQANTRTHELESLLESAKVVLENDEFPTTARKIFDATRKMTGAQSGYVALLSDDGHENEVLFLESGGLPCTVDPNLPMPVRGLRAEAYKSGQVACHNDFMNSKWAKFMPGGHVDLRNVMFSPLNIEGKTVGIMGLANKDGDFTEDDQRIAAAFGQLAAMALQNSRHLDQLTENEQELRQLEKRSSALVDHSPVCHKIVDLDFNLQYMSANGFRMLKMEQNDEYYGKPYPFDFFPESSREELSASLLEARDTKKVKTLESLASDAEGNAVWLHHSIIPVFNDDGFIHYITAVSADITERKQMEEQILDQRRELELVVNATSDAIWSWDFRNNQLTFSPSYYTMLGYEPDEFPADYENWVKRIHPDDLDQALAVANEYLQTKPDDYHNEFRMLTKDGSYRWIMTFAKVVERDENGEAVRLIGNHQDITERKDIEEKKKAVEEQFHQAQKMESVGRLAGGVAHDFNNLLTGITGNVSLALMDLPEGDPLRETLEEINQAADSAATLTRQLLAFSRKQLIAPKVVNLNQLIDRSYKMLRRLIGEDIDLVFRPEQKLRQTKVDPGQLEQVLVNLAVNARDAMPDGGKLTLETENVTLDDSYCRLHAHALPGEYVMIAVSDNGIGMDEKVREHLFEPFFTTKPKDKGTGLGLATVYGTIKQSGGNIEVYSEPGEGTTFKVYFPTVEAEAETIDRPAMWDDLPNGTETVLVVEDERMVRNIAVKILTRQGYTVIAAEDGPTALQMAENPESNIDLLMTDIIMPGMNGRELSIKLESKIPNLKTLYTSGYTENAIAHHGVLDEGVNFIGKPYTPQALAKKLREVLDG